MTCSRVLAALESVRDRRLQDVLYLSHTKWEELKGNRELIVKWWLETHHRALWEELGGKLLYYEETDEALKNVQVYIKVERGEWCAL